MVQHRSRRARAPRGNPDLDGKTLPVCELRFYDKTIRATQVDRSKRQKKVQPPASGFFNLHGLHRIRREVLLGASKGVFYRYAFESSRMRVLFARRATGVGWVKPFSPSLKIFCCFVVEQERVRGKNIPIN